MTTYTMDPQARLDFGVNWTAWLSPSETITTAVVAVTPTGLDLNPAGHATTINAGVVTFWLAGGVVGKTYTATCHIVTNQGREDDRSIRITIRDR